MDNRSLLLKNLHTTPLGQMRIARNLGWPADKDTLPMIQKYLVSVSSDAWTQRGKNWYVCCGDFSVTINAVSATIITAHKER